MYFRLESCSNGTKILVVMLPGQVRTIGIKLPCSSNWPLGACYAG